jgi:hypothetical protein
VLDHRTSRRIQRIRQVVPPPARPLRAAPAAAASAGTAVAATWPEPDALVDQEVNQVQLPFQQNVCATLFIGKMCIVLL